MNLRALPESDHARRRREHDAMVEAGHGMHECAPDCPPEMPDPAPSMRPRPVIGASVTSFAELDAYLLKRISDFRVDVDDDETAQHIGPDAQQRSRGRLAMLTEIRQVIREAVEDERTDQIIVTADESIESSWKEAGIEGRPDTALLDRVADGNR